MGITLYLGCWMGGSIGFYFIMGVTLYLGCLLEGFYCIFGFHLGSYFLMGFSCGLAELLICILHVYLEAPYAFLMKFSYLSKKKKGSSQVQEGIFSLLF